MKKTTLINIEKGGDYDEWVGKGSQWYPIPKKGKIKKSAEFYREWLNTESWLKDDIPSLRGMILACNESDMYYGEVLVSLANESLGKELPEIWQSDGIWHIRHNENEICMNTEKTAEMLLRLLRKGVEN